MALFNLWTFGAKYITIGKKKERIEAFLNSDQVQDFLWLGKFTFLGRKKQIFYLVAHKRCTWMFLVHYPSCLFRDVVRWNWFFEAVIVFFETSAAKGLDKNFQRGKRYLELSEHVFKLFHALDFGFFKEEEENHSIF